MSRRDSAGIKAERIGVINLNNRAITWVQHILAKTHYFKSNFPETHCGNNTFFQKRILAGFAVSTDQLHTNNIAKMFRRAEASMARFDMNPFPGKPELSKSFAAEIPDRLENAHRIAGPVRCNGLPG